MSPTLKVALIIFCFIGFCAFLYMYYQMIAYYYDWDKRLLAEKRKKDASAGNDP